MAATRKAAQGLNKIPSSKDEWKEAIKEYGLEKRTLEQLCLEGNFSASRVSKEAFLSIRCLWLKRISHQNATDYIAELDYFFNDAHVRDAAELMDRGLLGLDKLKALYRIICTPEEPHKKVPPGLSGTSSDTLGPFWVVVDIYKKLLDRSTQASIGEHELGASPRSVGAELSQMPKRYLLGDLEVEDVDVLDDEIEGEKYQPSASPPRAPAPAHPAAPPVLGSMVEEPPHRTPTETLVADFLGALLGGLVSHVRNLGPCPLLMEDSFETTYTFGPIRNTSQNQGDVQFRARIDGSIPCGEPLTGLPYEAAIFKANGSPRMNGADSVSVLAQQSMEHVAYIWNHHEHDLTWKNKDKTYRTFMVSQHHLHIHISIATYRTEYLGYIFGPGTQAVLPNGDENSYLEIQEFGPFDINSEEQLEKFLHIMLSFLIRQFKKTEAGEVIKKALKGSA